MLAEMNQSRLKSGYLPRNTSYVENHGHMPDRLCRNTFLRSNPTLTPNAEFLQFSITGLMMIE
jgi:hypothetical protein